MRNIHLTCYDGADERYFTDTYTLNSNEHY